VGVVGRLDPIKDGLCVGRARNARWIVTARRDAMIAEFLIEGHAMQNRDALAFERGAEADEVHGRQLVQHSIRQVDWELDVLMKRQCFVRSGTA
jgi:hypothetical protein